MLLYLCMFWQYRNGLLDVTALTTSSSLQRRNMEVIISEMDELLSSLVAVEKFIVHFPSMIMCACMKICMHVFMYVS